MSRNGKSLDERIGGIGRSTEVLVGVQCSEPQLDDVDLGCRHGVDVALDKIEGIVPVVVIATVSQGAVKYEHIGRCSLIGTRCHVFSVLSWLAVLGVPWWHG